MSRCQATTQPCYWWSSEKIEFRQCTKGATVEIDGVKMCLQHAGTLAVLKLIAQGNAKKLKDTGPLCDINQDKRWTKKIKKEKKKHVTKN